MGGGGGGIRTGIKWLLITHDVSKYFTGYPEVLPDKTRFSMKFWFLPSGQMTLREATKPNCKPSPLNERAE